MTTDDRYAHVADLHAAGMTIVRGSAAGIHPGNVHEMLPYALTEPVEAGTPAIAPRPDHWRLSASAWRRHWSSASTSRTVEGLSISGATPAVAARTDTLREPLPALILALTKHFGCEVGTSGPSGTRRCPTR
jgi:hypothetical protein